MFVHLLALALIISTHLFMLLTNTIIPNPFSLSNMVIRCKISLNNKTGCFTVLIPFFSPSEVISPLVIIRKKGLKYRNRSN